MKTSLEFLSELEELNHVQVEFSASVPGVQDLQLCVDQKTLVTVSISISGEWNVGVLVHIDHLDDSITQSSAESCKVQSDLTYKYRKFNFLVSLIASCIDLGKTLRSRPLHRFLRFLVSVTFWCLPWKPAVARCGKFAKGTVIYKNPDFPVPSKTNFNYASW